jgi:3-oxoadipate enol-lactonase
MKIAANGIQMNYRLEGPSTGSVVMLSHSLATDLTMWDAQIDALTRWHRLLRYDTRGHGGSDAPAGVYSLSQLAQDACGLLDVLGIERAHFIGLSMGGMIGQTLALETQSRLLSLVLCDTTSRIPADAKPAWDERIRIAGSEGMAPLVDSTIARWFTRGFREHRSDIVDRIRDLIRSTVPEGYIGCCHAIASLDVTDVLQKISVPTMVIVGEDDPGTPVAAAAVIHEKITNSELAIIQSASHLSNVERAEEFNRIVIEFLNRVEPHTEQ